MPDTGPGYMIVPAPDDGPERGRTSQRDKLIEVAVTSGLRFWRDPDGVAFVTVSRADRIERYAVRSRRFRLLLRQLYGERFPNAKASDAAGQTVPGAVSDTAMAEALPTLEGMAFNGELRLPEVRIARDGDTIWCDLGDESWRAIAISADGWRVVDRTDAPLMRPDSMRPMPVPSHAPGALGTLRGLLNVGSETDLILVTSWMVAAMWPDGPYPVLAIDGEQGSGKSTTCLMLRRLVDPNKAPLRAMPRWTDDIIIAARNGRVIAADNVSFIEPEMADALCRVATGGGLSKRALYTDGDEFVVHVCRPVLLNGIPDLLARGDLADRALAITLPPIADDARRPEAEVWAAFDAAAPGILALLLDGVAMALRRLPGLRVGTLPRMADFARLACAAAPAFGWTSEAVLAALRGNREAATLAVVEGDPVAEAVRGLLADRGGWSGTATELLAEFDHRVPVDVLRDRAWPKDAARLSARLKRAAPALRRVSVVVDMVREAHSGRRLVNIRPGDTPKSASLASQASPCGENAKCISSLMGDAPGDDVGWSASPTASPVLPARSGDAQGDARVTLPSSPKSMVTSITYAHGDAGDADLASTSGRDVAVAGLLASARRHGVGRTDNIGEVSSW